MTATARSSRDPRKILIIAAVLFGGLSACLSFAYLRSQQVQADPIPMTSVVVARQEIPARTAITPAMLEVKEVPQDARLAESYQDLAAVVGKVPKFPINKGEQILPAKLISERADSVIAPQIPPGKRAMGIGVNEVVGTGGLLSPGDFVDVLTIFEKDRVGRNTAVVILQNIEVLAVGQATDSSARNSADPKVAQQTSPDRVRSAVLAVNLEEAERLALAEEFGRIRLVVRPAKDAAIVPITEKELSTLLSGAGGR